MEPTLTILGHRAERQHGLITAADLLDLEISRGSRRRLLEKGNLIATGTRSYRLAGSPPSLRQQILAACVDVNGLASHRTAAALHGLDGFHLTAPIEVLVTEGRCNPRSKLARVHSTRWLPPDDRIEIDGIPTTSVARTLMLLAGIVPEIPIELVRGAVDEAVATNKATDKWLWARLESLRRSGRNGVLVLEEILSDRAGGAVTESWLEREALRILTDAGLPLPVCQARIERRGAFVARVDFIYEEQRAIIEVSGYASHRTKRQTTADAKRRRELTLAGFQVHEFTYEEIVDTPEILVAAVRAILGLSPTAPGSVRA